MQLTIRRLNFDLRLTFWYVSRGLSVLVQRQVEHFKVAASPPALQGAAAWPLVCCRSLTKQYINSAGRYFYVIEGGIDSYHRAFKGPKEDNLYRREKHAVFLIYFTCRAMFMLRVPSVCCGDFWYRDSK